MRRFLLLLGLFAVTGFIMVAAIAQPTGFSRTEVKSGGMLSLACEEVYGLNPKRLSSAPCWEGAQHPDGTVVANPDFIFPGEFDLPAPPYGVAVAEAPTEVLVPDTPAFPVVEEGPLFSPNPFANPVDPSHAAGIVDSPMGFTTSVTINPPMLDVFGMEWNLAWVIVVVLALALAGSMMIDAFGEHVRVPARAKRRSA